MNAKSYLKILKYIRFKWVIMSGIFTYHILGKRYLGIYIDPSLSCNLRCKMCYFSDAEKRQQLKGNISTPDMHTIASALFHRALKVQIGCGAEPTVSSNWVELVVLAKKHGVPYVSLTTNGNLLTRHKLEQAIEAGLDEITLSAHGMTPHTYETLMTNARFDVFVQLTNNLRELKDKYPKFKVRVNYTINRDNFDELINLPEVMGNVPDIVQVRPIQKIGNSQYDNFDLSYIRQNYDKVLMRFVNRCREQGIEVIYPSKANLDMLSKSADYDNRIEEATYCYVSATSCWKPDFDFRNETFESYAKRTRLARKLFRAIFGKQKKSIVDTTRKLNYTV